jgi:hypothetical protein
MDAYFVDSMGWWYWGKRKLLTVFVLDRHPESILATRLSSKSKDAPMSLF